jgi:hypothetical protein
VCYDSHRSVESLCMEHLSLSVSSSSQQQRLLVQGYLGLLVVAQWRVEKTSPGSDLERYLFGVGDDE